MKTYFHASPKRFSFGDILTGGHEGGAGHKHWNVCMTNSPVPHATIDNHVTNDWHVYEVEPTCEVIYREESGEYQTRVARVIRRVGNAKAILENSGGKGSYVKFSEFKDRFHHL